MTQEEKAKAYDEAIKVARQYYNDKVMPIGTNFKLEKIFPELAESEDERIRKEMIEILKKEAHDFPSSVIAEKSNSWIAWLEKQGEQKPANKVEPKFKVGYWVFIEQIDNIINGPRKIKEVNDYGYVLDGIRETTLPFTSEHCMRLWTIQDAKDGDVLASEDKVFLYNGKLDLRGRVCAYCGIYKTYDGLHFTKCAVGNYFTYKEPYPATKEQCDLLFTKMKEAGYEWDAEKRELKKIEQKPIDYIQAENCEKVGGYSIKENSSSYPTTPAMFSEQTSAWSEEDKKMSRFIGNAITADAASEYLGSKGIQAIDVQLWLEKLKERVQLQPKREWSERDEINRDLLYNALNQVYDMEHNKDLSTWINKRILLCSKQLAWSEEDERMFNSALWHVKNSCGNGGKNSGEFEVYNWLKDLKDRVQPKQEWKRENTYDLTDFENVMMHIGSSFFGENAGLDPNDTNAIKQQANILMELIPKQEWNEEDERTYKSVLYAFEHNYPLNNEQQKFVKSFKDRYTWKPSDEQIEILDMVLTNESMDDNIARILRELREQLKKLKG